MRFKYWFYESGDLNPQGGGDLQDPSSSRKQKIYPKDVDVVAGDNRKRKFHPSLRKGPPLLVRKDED